MGQHRRFHLIGIGGIGMSALAHILLDQGELVTGSDKGTSSLVDELRARGAHIFKNHSNRYISHDTTVVYSTAVTEDNPEYQTAVELKCPLLHRSELLAEMAEKTDALAVTGTHGKTTTTSLLTAIFLEAKFHPSYAIGGLLGGKNGKLGSGKSFLFEADESDGSFLRYHPKGAIITNLEKEHMEHYKTEEKLVQAFGEFFAQVTDHTQLLWCKDCATLAALNPPGMSYGFSEGAEIQITNYRQEGWKLFFDLSFRGMNYRAIEVAMVGRHQALNAAAASAMALIRGISEEAIRKALKHFPGVSRRLERRGELNRRLFIDDYAHHPTEIRAALAAVKEAVSPRRVVALFQPHRYTRTAEHLEEFARAFESADLVYVTDIYGAGESPIKGISGVRVADEISHDMECHYVPEGKWMQVVENLLPYDVCVTLGAGSITRLHNQVKAHPPERKLRVGLFFGGKSLEHDISLRSARFVKEALNPALYEMVYCGIDPKGMWTIGEKALEQLEYSTHLTGEYPFFDRAVIEEIVGCDLFFPILHGPNGEDGAIQGFFEMLDKPYVGSGVEASAVAMSKVQAKRIAQAIGVRTPSFCHFTEIEWKRDRKGCVDKVEHELAYPLYVKPVHMGSSMGIRKVATGEELPSAIDFAFEHDATVMVEMSVEGARELEFPVLGNVRSSQIEVPPPGEKLSGGAFVDWKKKYSKEAVGVHIEADLPDTVMEKGRALARKIYLAVGCAGLSRVDFLLDPEGQWWFFEINTMPGMQKLSLTPKVWEKRGRGGAAFVDHLVILALAEKRLRPCALS